jgi:hypothetical protein
MIIAREKKKTNVAEYIIYMWQIEDIIRSVSFSIDTIQKDIISQFDQPDTVKYEMRKWYFELIRMMEEEGITKQGHLQFLQHTVNEMNDFHRLLLLSPKQKEYHQLYLKAKPNIDALAQRGDKREHNEIDTCLTGLYGLMMLKLKKTAVSPETMQSMQSISFLLASLSDFFRRYESGELDLETI